VLFGGVASWCLIILVVFNYLVFGVGWYLNCLVECGWFWCLISEVDYLVFEFKLLVVFGVWWVEFNCLVNLIWYGLII
jgi:hypothetical protein